MSDAILKAHFYIIMFLILLALATTLAVAH